MKLKTSRTGVLGALPSKQQMTSPRVLRRLFPKPTQVHSAFVAPWRDYIRRFTQSRDCTSSAFRSPISVSMSAVGIYQQLPFIYQLLDLHGRCQRGRPNEVVVQANPSNKRKLFSSRIPCHCDYPLSNNLTVGVLPLPPIDDLGTGPQTCLDVLLGFTTSGKRQILHLSLSTVRCRITPETKCSMRFPRSMAYGVQSQTLVRRGCLGRERRGDQ